ncbi:MAG: hypothetical protein U1D06_12325, partial [Paracoccaceae bacterium]|nr:hypothetical protein [Paracoccaceae bacterium]
MLRELLFVLSLTVALLSGYVALREYRAALFAGDSLEMQILTLGGPPSGQPQTHPPTHPPTRPLAWPLSWRGQHALLAGCSTLQFSTLLRFQLAETRMRVQQRCHDAATRVLARAPTVGLAYLV